MNKIHLPLLTLVLLALVFLEQSTARASSIATSNLQVILTLSYDSSKMEWKNIYSTLETSTSGSVWNPGGLWGLSDSKTKYDSSPGWLPTPDPIALNHGGSYADVSNSASGGPPFQATGTIGVKATADGVTDTDVEAYGITSYYAGLHALAGGSFTLTVDYNGTWNGSTSALGDQAYLGGYVYAVIDTITQGNNEYIFTPVVDPLSQNAYKVLQDGASGSIDDFSNKSASFTVNFDADQYFYIQVIGDQWLEAVSPQQTSEVPEPTSLILLGSGLAGIALAAWCRKR